jgi:hypothetical protein
MRTDVVSDGKHAPDAKTYRGLATITTGTGKYTGISGSFTSVLHGPQFKTAAEGTYAQYGEIQATYKLP